MKDFDELPELCKSCDMLIAVPANIDKDDELIYACMIGIHDPKETCTFYEGLTDQENN